MGDYSSPESEQTFMIQKSTISSSSSVKSEGSSGYTLFVTGCVLVVVGLCLPFLIIGAFLFYRSRRPAVPNRRYELASGNNSHNVPTKVS